MKSYHRQDVRLSSKLPHLQETRSDAQGRNSSFRHPRRPCATDRLCTVPKKDVALCAFLPHPLPFDIELSLLVCHVDNLLAVTYNQQLPPP